MLPEDRTLSSPFLGYTGIFFRKGMVGIGTWFLGDPQRLKAPSIHEGWQERIIRITLAVD